MSTVAIMQPYLFPYIGYYQLATYSDVFVFLDDVNFIKGGFINRNWLVDTTGRLVRFTLPVKAISSNRPINQHYYGDAHGKLIRMIRQCYPHAIGFDTYYPLFEEIVQDSPGQRVSAINAESITRIVSTLGLTTEFLFASDIDPDPADGGQRRVLRLCRELGATRYVNLPGGRELYDPAEFRSHDIKLEFINPSRPNTGSAFARPPSFLHYLMTQTHEDCVRVLDPMETLR